SSGRSTQIRCWVPNIGLVPKWLFVTSGSRDIVIALPSNVVIWVETSVTGPSFIVTVEVPLNVVELVTLSLVGLPTITKSYIECLCSAVPPNFVIQKVELKIGVDEFMLENL